MHPRTRDLHVLIPDAGADEPKPNQGSATTRATKPATAPATSAVAVVQPEWSAGTASVAVDQPERPVPPFPQVKACDEEKSMTSTRTPAPAGWLRWKGLLALAATTSIGLNIWHAVETSGYGAAVLASIAPLYLFWIVHNLVTEPGGTRGWRKDKVGVSAAAVVALGAFAISYVTQRDLVLLLGMEEFVANILPLIVDLTIAVASYKLVHEAELAAAAEQAPEQTVHQPVQTTANRDTEPVTQPVEVPAMRDAAPAPAATQTTSVRDAEPQQPATQTATLRDALRDADTEELPLTRDDSRDAAAKHRDEAPTTRRLAAVPTPRPAATHAPASAATQTATDRDAEDGDEYLRRAELLVEAGRTTAPLAAVHRVLRGKANGETNRELADVTGLSESAVQRIVTASRELVTA
ncbi:DUF2637 domain-containing protein [Mycobacteroides abscessus]|uniref:DUF2637 domain-containing protein n=1 Tax=Mycobacteroides abscessus TaxID=36809 RepID=UPI0011C46D15|nr:DUF2637 domain-containing protein [Mycobacteroides abscessus]